MNRLAAFAHLVVVISLLSLTCLAQPPKESIPQLAVQFDSGSGTVFEMPVFKDGGGGSSTVQQIDSWKPAKGQARADMVDIKLGSEGEVVIVTLSVRLENDKQVTVATYRLKEGETVRTEELKAFGVEPCELRVVKAKPHFVEPLPPITAKLDNKTKSLEVVEFFQEAPPSTTFRLTLRNASNKNVTGLDLFVPSPDGNGGGGQRTTGYKGQSLMIPGGASTHFISVSRGRRLTPNGFVYDDLTKQTIIIRAIIFDDGTYEGLVEVVAEIEGERRGLEIQRRRILQLLQEVSKPVQDQALSFEALKERVYALSKTGDESVAKEILARFPTLAPRLKDSLVMSVGVGMSTEKQSFLHSISEFEERQKQPGAEESLTDWIKRMSLQYAKLTSTP